MRAARLQQWIFGLIVVTFNLTSPRDLSAESAEILRQLDSLMGHESVSSDYVRLRIQLLKAQTDAYNKLSRATPAADVTAPSCQPCFNARDVDLVIARTLLGRITTITRNHGRGANNLTPLCDAVDAQSNLLPQLVQEVVSAENNSVASAVAKQTGVNLQTLTFVTRVLTAPFATRAMRLSMQQDLPEPSDSGRCPSCGCEPGLSLLLREDGKRILACNLCACLWRFPRAQCPFCAKSDALNVFRFDESTPHGMAACDACLSYIKTVDTRLLPEDRAVFPLVETTAAMYLDMIAEHEGYAQASTYAALR